ncbi:response regulator transcription factor [Streptomyces sp. NPDC048002]|uniref:response regulator transcription factor n=1 Tax=Streptomyces sp. NPDC048002 TaxID=3154344 RepID=UPI0033D591E8
MTTVLVANHHSLERYCYGMLLSQHPDLDVVGEAAEGEDVIRRVGQLHPDVVLLDLQMPGLDSCTATRSITQSGGTSKVLAMAGCELDEHVYSVLHAGASGFLFKDAYADELVAAIRTVAAGDNVVSPQLFRQLIGGLPRRLTDLDPGRKRRLAALTPREREVLAAVAAGLNNTEISQRFHVAPSTVKSHVGRLLTKIGARDRVQAVIFAYEVGLAGLPTDREAL